MKPSFIKLFLITFVILLLFFSGTPLILAASIESGNVNGLPNPIGPSDMTMRDILIQVMQLVLGGIGIIALVMFIYGGLVMLFSGGNPDRVKKAKDTLMWAILGLATILLSGIIVRYIFDNFQF